MISYKIHLIRTGSTGVDDTRIYVGQSDPPLSKKGREELELLTRELEYPPVDMVYTSPLRRCLQTAEFLYPDRYTVALDSLMDMHMGDFQGKSYQELRDDEAFGKWLHNSFENAPPGGENAADFTGRVVRALGEVFAGMMTNQVGSAAVITHAGVIMTLLGAVGVPKLPVPQWMVPNGIGYTLLMTPQMWMRDNSVEVFSPIPAEREAPQAPEHEIWDLE